MKNAKLGRLVVLLSTAWFVIFLDQLTKFLVIENLKPAQPVPFIGDLVKLVLVYNDSAAFSIGFGATWIFAIVSSLATLVLLWLAPKLETRAWSLVGGIALGGVVGNLIDRLMRPPGFGQGQVVDFISIPFNFPIFNLADTFLVIGVSLAMIRTLMGDEVGGKVGK